MRDTPDAAPGAAAKPVLRLWLIVPDTITPEPGLQRLADRLSTDPRYKLDAILTAPAAEAPLTPLARAGFGLESALFPPPAAGHLPDLPRTRPVGDPPETDQPDLVLDFSGDDAAGRLGRAARFGLWRLDCFAPLGALDPALKGDPASPVRLTMHPAEGPARLVAGCVFDTKDLATLNQSYIREKSILLVLRELARLHRDGRSAVLGPAPAPTAPPGLSDLRAYTGRTLDRAAYRLRRKLRTRAGGTPEAFQLRLATGGPLEFDPAEGIALPNPPGTFRADPFLIEEAGTLWCFFEEFVYATGRGHLAVGRVAGDRLEDVRPVMTPGHHLSFPFLFRHDGAIYMIPEAHETGRLEIWRATDFPDGWALHATAFEGEALADSVLFPKDGAWWLFTNKSHDRFKDFCGALELYRVDGPELTRVEPHPLNPVVVGSDTARAAGRVIAQDGRLLRLSQDNSGGVYGWGLNVMEITELTPDAYAERRLRHITPDFAPGLIGCHHADFAAGRAVFDVRLP